MFSLEQDLEKFFHTRLLDNMPERDAVIENFINQNTRHGQHALMSLLMTNLRQRFESWARYKLYLPDCVDDHEEKNKKTRTQVLKAACKVAGFMDAEELTAKLMALSHYYTKEGLELACLKAEPFIYP